MNWRTGCPCCERRGAALSGPGDNAAGAQIGVTAEALRAAAAKPREAGDDMVAEP